VTAERTIVDGATTLHLPRHIKFRYDEQRAAWIILAPERLLLPDEPSVATLKLIDGARSVDAIIDELAKAYAAPRAVIAKDVTALLQDLVDKGVLAR
jgi:pyrroloquinoline quinone biosynthesis protein D